MDSLTLDAYDRLSGNHAGTWDQQDEPADLYSLLSQYFIPSLTADVGCGSGRDTAWLAGHGFDAIGFDASEALLEEARRRHPPIVFRRAVLPELAEIIGSQFANVLCGTVIPGGTLCVSWRASEGPSKGDHDGRLYSRIDVATVTEQLGTAVILHNAEKQSPSSGPRVHRLIIRLPR